MEMDEDEDEDEDDDDDEDEVAASAVPARVSPPPQSNDRRSSASSSALPAAAGASNLHQSGPVHVLPTHDLGLHLYSADELAHLPTQLFDMLTAPIVRRAPDAWRDLHQLLGLILAREPAAAAAAAASPSAKRARRE
jgi:hypothetical protein